MYGQARFDQEQGEILEAEHFWKEWTESDRFSGIRNYQTRDVIYHPDGRIPKQEGVLTLEPV